MLPGFLLCQIIAQFWVMRLGRFLIVSARLNTASKREIIFLLFKLIVGNYNIFMIKYTK